jgi:hypothetical protein
MTTPTIPQTADGAVAVTLFRILSNIVASYDSDGSAMDFHSAIREARKLVNSEDSIGVIPGDVWIALQSERVEFLDIFIGRLKNGYRPSDEELSGLANLVREAVIMRLQLTQDVRQIANAIDGATSNLRGALNLVETLHESAMLMAKGERPDFRSGREKRKDKLAEAEG